MGGLFGGGGGEKVIVREPVQEVEEEKKKVKEKRTSLFKTSGGARGEEIRPGGVLFSDDTRRDTFFGN